MEQISCYERAAEGCAKVDPCNCICCGRFSYYFFMSNAFIPITGEVTNIYWAVRAHCSAVRIKITEPRHFFWSRRVHKSLSWITFTSSLRSFAWFVTYYGGKNGKAFSDSTGMDHRLPLIFAGVAAAPIILTDISRCILKNKTFFWIQNGHQGALVPFPSNVVHVLEQLFKGFIPILPIWKTLSVSTLRQEWLADTSPHPITYHETPIAPEQKDALVVKQMEDNGITAIGQSLLLGLSLSLYLPSDTDFKFSFTGKPSKLLMIIPIITGIFILYLGYGFVRNMRSHRNYLNNNEPPRDIF